MLKSTAEDARSGAESARGVRVFGLPIVDSLLPDGVPVPCSVLITAEPGSGNDIISTAIIQEHLSSSLSVPFQEQKALWLSLDNFVNDLRNSLDNETISTQPKIQFIDCYSSQIGIDSKERYHADPSNLPYLSMVTSAAISELNNGGRLLLVLDSLTSLIQKVGVRRSIEFFRTLVGKTRSISADLLTTLNRRAFTEATIATFADLTDLVVDLSVEDNESSVGKLRVRKARGVRRYLGWRNYKIDFERRTLQYDSLASMPVAEAKDEIPLDLSNNSNHDDWTHDHNRFLENRGTNTTCAGPYCTFGGRAISEREHLAIFAEAVSTMNRKYQGALRLIADTLSKNQTKGNGDNDGRLPEEISDQIEKMEKLYGLVKSQTKIHPSIRRSSVEEVIQGALSASPLPPNVGVEREPNGSLEIQMDPALVTRAINGVIDAAVHEMPRGGSLSVRGYKEGDMAVIQVKGGGLGNWSDDLSSMFESSDNQNPVVVLGLVVARSFVEAHGGRLLIQSQRNEGTTFTIKLPI